jgi:hypothetical protein
MGREVVYPAEAIPSISRGDIQHSKALNASFIQARLENRVRTTFKLYILTKF